MYVKLPMILIMPTIPILVHHVLATRSLSQLELLLDNSHDEPSWAMQKIYPIDSIIVGEGSEKLKYITHTQYVESMTLLEVGILQLQTIFGGYSMVTVLANGGSRIFLRILNNKHVYCHWCTK
mmetsp:Transcript_15309/g.16553  ORF Transcript_15309/g.16553 Transcript_15309/m.16553 type:complete len:123 (-) Transcript_15309:167-535(-)